MDDGPKGRAPPTRWKESEGTQRVFCRWALGCYCYIWEQSPIIVAFLSPFSLHPPVTYHYYHHYCYLPLSGELILLTDPAEVITPPSHSNGDDNDAAAAAAAVAGVSGHGNHDARVLFLYNRYASTAIIIVAPIPLTPLLPRAVLDPHPSRLVLHLHL